MIYIIKLLILFGTICFLHFNLHLSGIICQKRENEISLSKIFKQIDNKLCKHAQYMHNTQIACTDSLSFITTCKSCIPKTFRNIESQTINSLPLINVFSHSENTLIRSKELIVYDSIFLKVFGIHDFLY